MNKSIAITTLMIAALTAGPTAAPARPRAVVPVRAAQAEILRFDVAENASRYAFDADPLDANGMPAYGNEFITEGYIYPHGFLDGREGVKEDGSPAFPDEILGRWSCRGWHVGEGATTKTGPWVLTNQIYDLGKTPGAKTLLTEGYEIVDLGVAAKRAVTGGTGRYSTARGDASQVMLGFNQAGGVNLRFEVRVAR